MISAKELADALEAHAAEQEREAESMLAIARTMLKPGERRTKQELEAKARTRSQIVYHGRQTIRAMKAAGLI